jgi:large subunit ribosomal protein L30
MAQFNIKLVKSLNGRLKKHVDTAHSLGLFKIRDESVQPDNAQTRGKIQEISYLLDVKEA